MSSKKEKKCLIPVLDIVLISLASSAAFFLGAYYTSFPAFQIRDNLGVTGEINIIKVFIWSVIFGFIIFAGLLVLDWVVDY